MNNSNELHSGLGRFAPFTLIREASPLAPLLDQHRCLILHAPAGSGKRVAVRNYFAKRRFRFRHITWNLHGLKELRADGSASSDDQRIKVEFSTLSSLHELLRQHALLTPDHYLWIDVRDAGESLPWQELFHLEGHSTTSLKIVVTTPFYPQDLRIHESSSFGYRSCFGKLAFSPSELEQVLTLAWPGIASHQLQDALFALTGGWPLAIMLSLADCLGSGLPAQDSLAVDADTLDTSDFEQRCRNRVAALAAVHSGIHSFEAVQLLMFIHHLGRLPVGLFEQGGPLADQQDNLTELQALGLIISATGVQPSVWLCCSRFATILASHCKQQPDTRQLRASAEWLATHGYTALALKVWVTLESWPQVEALLLDHGDSMIAQLRIDEMASWLHTLDSAQGINDPRLLINAIRCALYQGNRLAVEQYFERVIQRLKQTTPTVLATTMPPQRWSRFLAELLLYSHMLGCEEALCRQWSDSAQTELNQSSTTHLLQQAFTAAEAGDLSRAAPLIVAGLNKAAGSESAPHFVILAMMHVWISVLSCQLEQAEAFLADIRQKLIQDRVAYLGVYEWLDLLVVLLARMRGDLIETEAAAQQLLQQPVFTRDFLKHHLLLNVRADILLVRQDFYAARQTIVQIAAMQKNSASRSYWFGSARLMENCLDQLEPNRETEMTGANRPDSAVIADVLAVPPIEDLAPKLSRVQLQTELLWGLKLHLYQNRQPDILPVIEAFAIHCAQTGQWLRLLELDLVRAVYLLRMGNTETAFCLFGNVVLQLEQKRLLGVLLDPFLLWREFLQQERAFAHRERLMMLYRQARPFDEFASAPVATTPLVDKLSKRERQILALLVQGARNQDIADQLHVSVTTVRSHVQNIYRKLNVPNRSAATASAIQNKLV